MTFRPVTITEPVAPLAPLVVDSPHSGRIYPADFAYTCPLPLLRQTEDFLVDELISGAAQAGATIIAAEFPRCYIDANRAENDLDPALLSSAWQKPLEPSERTLMGLGLVRRLCKSGVPVYGAPLSVIEVERRIETYHRPYHAAVHDTLATRMKQFGTATLINCHSMPGRSERADRQHPDFVLGDRDGTSCAPFLTQTAKVILQDMGYNVWLNDPFKGVEILRRYGQPHKGQHALQLEINRKIYMNEEKLEKTAGFEKLQSDLTRFFKLLADELRVENERPLAAE